VGLRGGVSTYGYVGAGPLRNADPSGLFVPSVHNQITATAMGRAGTSCSRLPELVALGDFLPDWETSQAPENSHWHAMSNGDNPAANFYTTQNLFN
jgi:hypothetical protein